MPATVSSIVDLVHRKVDHTDFPDDLVLGLINNVQRRMQRRYPIFWQQAISEQTITTAGSSWRAFALPADHKQIDAVFAVVSGAHTPVAHRRDFLNLMSEYAGATDTKMPSFWSRWGNSGYLFPGLSSALTIQVFYHKMLDDLPSVTATNDFVSLAPEVLEYGAIAEYFDEIRETDKALIWHAKADGAMQLFLKQQRQNEESPHEPIPEVPGTIRRRKRAAYRGYTWW